MRKKIKVIVEKTNTGFSAYAEKYPVATTGSDIYEIRKNITEAMNLYLEDSKESVSFGDMQVIIDLKQFFDFYKVLNARAVSERIGMNYTLLNQYIKGKKKPSQQQVEKVMEGINEIGKELSKVTMV